MPLPDRNQEWPPATEREPRKLYRKWGAWYGGDHQQLSEAYADVAGLDGTGDLPRGQPAGGARLTTTLIRGVQRMFWGTPTAVGQIRSHKLHIPLAGDIASTSADLLFGEPPQFEFGEPGKGGGKAKAGTQQRLDEILEESNFEAVMLEQAEIAAAYGGAYVRIRWDPVLADCPLFDAIPPDCAIPDFRGGRLTAVTLWRDLDRIDGRTWRHLERHEPGKILHGLYVSADPDRLGRPMALTDHPETTPFAMLVDAADGQTVETGAKSLTCEYIPNMRPHRMIRGSALGRSDYSGIEPLMDALDEAWTSWMRDLRIGKGRLIVPRQYVQNRGRGHGSTFDPEREVFEAVEGVADSGEGGLKIQVVQFAIRVEEHSRTCREITTQALRGGGYSAQTFGETDQVAATATEVTAREGKSYKTRKKKILYQRGPLGRLQRTALEVDVAKFGTRNITPELPSVNFPDGVSVDPEQNARTLQMINAAVAASIRTRVKLLNPDWDDPEVDAEVIRIKEETGHPAMGAPVAEPGLATTGHGLPGTGPAGGPAQTRWSTPPPGSNPPNPTTTPPPGGAGQPKPSPNKGAPKQ